MDKELKEQLKRTIKGYRPRPLMHVGWHNGKRCYVRKRDLTYWRLLEKYPPKPRWKNIFKTRHILAKQHHLTPHRLRHKLGSSLVWGFLAAFIIFTVIMYAAAFIAAIL